MIITPKALKDLQLARKHAVSEYSILTPSVKDIIGCLDNISHESCKEVKQYLKWQNGTILGYRWLELKEMCNEITNPKT